MDKSRDEVAAAKPLVWLTREVVAVGKVVLFGNWAPTEDTMIKMLARRFIIVRTKHSNAEQEGLRT